MEEIDPDPPGRIVHNGIFGHFCIDDEPRNRKMEISYSQLALCPIPQRRKP